MNNEKAFSRVCQPLFSDPTAQSKVCFGYAAAERTLNPLAGKKCRKNPQVQQVASGRRPVSGRVLHKARLYPGHPQHKTFPAYLRLANSGLGRITPCHLFLFPSKGGKSPPCLQPCGLPAPPLSGGKNVHYLFLLTSSFFLLKVGSFPPASSPAVFRHPLPRGQKCSLPLPFYLFLFPSKGGKSPPCLQPCGLPAPPSAGAKMFITSSFFLLKVGSFPPASSPAVFRHPPLRGQKCSLLLPFYLFFFTY
jgi:hypothetical protein